MQTHIYECVSIYFYINTCVYIYDFPGGSDSIEFACNVEDPGLILGARRRKWQPTPVLLPGEFHGLRSL